MDSNILNESAARQREAYLKMSPEEQRDYLAIKYHSSGTYTRCKRHDIN